MATPITPRELASLFVKLLKERTAINDSDDDLRERFRRVYELVENIFVGGPNASRELLFRELAHQTADPDLPMWEFACVANTVGVGVENGCDPGYALGNILERLTGQLQSANDLSAVMLEQTGVGDIELIPEPEWPTYANRSPEVATAMRASLALNLNAKAAMTMLCRSMDLRQQARTRGDLVQAAVDARGASRYAYFLSEVLIMTDELDIIVLDPARTIGYVVRLEAVRNCSHFFTLLQGALLSHPTASQWQGKRPNPLLVQIARGERLIDSVSEAEWIAQGVRDDKGEVFDHAIWQFYQWPALQPDGTIETAAQAAPYHPWWVWGQTFANEILELDGVRVVILGEPEMPMKWGIPYFSPLHPALRSNVAVRSVLNADSVKGWLERIRSMPRENNPLPPVTESAA